MSGIAFHHGIGKQQLLVDVDSHETALSLQSWLSDVNRNRFLPLIERVLDELDVPDRHVTIGDLHIDLGTLPLNGFVEVAEERLYRELRIAVERALHELNNGSAVEHRSRSEQKARLELLEYYLLYGTLPAWASRGSTFSFAELFAEVAKSSPELLVSLVKRHGRQKQFLQRLAMQLTEPLFRELIHLLEPAHAALVIAYMMDLRVLHRAEPLIELSEERFAQHLRVLILTYLVRERGSQFNRKSYVKSLLEGIAESEGLEYLKIMKTLTRGLEYTERKSPLKSSLPGVLRELARDLQRQTPQDRVESTASTKASSDQGAASGTARTAVEDSSTDVTSADVTSPAADVDQLGPEVTFHRYDQLEVLRYYLRHGLLPWPAALQDPQLTAQRILSSLMRLPSSLLEAALARRRPDDRLPELLSALRSLTETDLLKLLVRLLPAADNESPFRSSLNTFALQAGDRAAFYARLIFATVHGRPLDLEQLAAAGPLTPAEITSFLADDLDQWDDQLLASALLHQLRQDKQSHDRLPSTPDLLRALLTSHPSQARRFLVSLRGTTSLRRTLVQQCPPNLFDRIVELIRPDGSTTIRRLTRQLVQIVASHGPGSARGVRHQVLYVLLGVADGHPLTVHFFADVLHELFGSSLPSTVRDLLWQVTVVLVKSAGVPQRHVSALRLAIQSEGVDGKPLHMSAALTEPSRDAALQFADLHCWSLNQLRAALLRGLHRGDPVGNQHRRADLLRMLLEAHPQACRELLVDVRGETVLRHALVQTCSPPMTNRIFEVLRPQESRTLRELTKTLAAIPAPYRPTSAEGMRHGVLDVLLSFRDGDRLSENFFAQVLLKLYGDHVPERVRELLLRAASEWTTLDEVPDAHASAFQEAVRSLGTSPPEASSGEERDQQGGDPISDPAATEEQQSRWTAALAFLLEGRQASTSATSGADGNGSGRRVLSEHALQDELRRRLEEAPQDVLAVIRPHLGDSRKRSLWAHRLSESVLVRLIYALEPQAYRKLLSATELLASAWLEVAPSKIRSRCTRSHFWAFLLEFLAQHQEGSRSQERLVASFVTYVTAELPVSSSTDLGERFIQRAARLAREAGNASLVATLHRDRERLTTLISAPAVAGGSQEKNVNSQTETRQSAAAVKTDSKADRPQAFHEIPTPLRQRTAFSMGTETDVVESDDPIYVANAGLILAGPFFPQLFQTLEMLTPDDDGVMRFQDAATAARAVHLLQMLVDGRANAPEPELVLNKILCGIPLGVPIDAAVDPTEQEREVCEKLLRSIVANWPIIRDTSIEGLQQTFLQREGKLDHVSDRWNLQVQRKTLDVLTDQIPWSISVVYHRWMSQPIHVTW